MRSLSVAACLLLTLQVVWSHSGELKECLDQHHATMDDVKKFFDDKTASDEFKCFMKCMMIQLGGMKEDGTFDVENINTNEKHEKLDESTKAAIEECTKIEKSDDLCDLAYRHSVCMREKIPQKYREIVEELMEGL